MEDQKSILVLNLNSVMRKPDEWTSTCHWIKPKELELDPAPIFINKLELSFIFNFLDFFSKSMVKEMAHDKPDYLNKVKECEFSQILVSTQ